MRLAQLFWLFFLIALPMTAPAEQGASQREIHTEIQQVYNFQPHTLTDAQIAQKSTVLDQFWSRAKSDKNSYAPALRKELADFSNPPFFLYDGSKLLLSLSNDPSDRPLVLAAIAHSDLRDLQFLDYFMLVHSMASRGENTTAAAFNILKQSKFQVFIPQHSLTMGQDYCLIYMLLPTNPDFWVEPAIEKLKGEKDPTAQKSLLLLLFYAQTPEADKAVAAFSRDSARNQGTRSYATQLMHRKDSIPRSFRNEVLTTSEESLRKARRERMNAVSDEALYDLDSYTAKIIAKRK